MMGLSLKDLASVASASNQIGAHSQRSTRAAYIERVAEGFVCGVVFGTVHNGQGRPEAAIVRFHNDPIAPPGWGRPGIVSQRRDGAG
ncbi:hypothetical protein G6F57_023412 [Rhizopus arrhizus]|nr:hypothetical protein G6F57_023412 [Rhizopus arrhizus]